jgi:trehalose 6-phosphate synthase
VVSRIVVASNRGPVSFTASDDGTLTARRGAGGLVSALAPLLADGAATWVCSAMSDGDRRAAAGAPGGRLHEAGHDTGGASVRMLGVDPRTFDRAYNGIANGTLWFITHHLYDLPNQPVFDGAWRRVWDCYVELNETFATACAEEAAPGGAVVVQDYHLFLVPALLKSKRPDLRVGHFTHTPWPDPAQLRLLPDDVRAALLHGLLAADSVGYHTRRWADAFLACAADALGPDGARADRVRVHPIGVDADELRERAAAPDVAARRAALEEWAAGRQVVLRIDRTELSKNVVRGLAAFRELLRTHPEHHERVVHLAFAYPSRHDLPEYREYTAAVQRMAAAVNDEFARPGWQPVRLEVSDDYPRSLAALSLADVLVVNPVRDGMNLVAKEGPVLSRDGVALVLSREAGAAEELGGDSFCVNPFDVTATAEAIDAALALDPAERRARSDRLAAAAAAHPPQRWLTEQLAALGS